MQPEPHSPPTLGMLSPEQKIPLTPALDKQSFSLWGADALSAHAIVTGAPNLMKGVIAANMAEIVSREQAQVIWITDDGSLEGIAARANAPYHRLAFTTGRSAGADGNVSGMSLLPPHDEPAICINPFWRPADNDGQAYPLTLDEQMDIARLMVVMLESVGADLTRPHYRSNLHQLLYSVIGVCFNIEHEKSPSNEIVFTDFIRYLKRNSTGELKGEEVADLLSPFYGEGKYASLFDGSCRLPNAEGLAIFSLQTLEDTPALAPAALALQQQLGVRIRFGMSRADKKAMVFNHSWGRHLTPQYANSIAGLLRDFRRYCGSCIFITGDQHALERIQQACPGEDDDGVFGNLSHHFLVQQTAGSYVLVHTLMQGTGAPAATTAQPGKPAASDMLELDHQLKPLLSWASRFSDNPLAFLVETLKAKLPSSQHPGQ